MKINYSIHSDPLRQTRETFAETLNAKTVSLAYGDKVVNLPVGVNFTKIPLTKQEEKRSEANLYEKAHVTMTLVFQSFTYAKEAKGLFAKVKAEEFKKKARVIDELSADLRRLHWQEGATQQFGFLQEEADYVEDLCKKQFGQLYNAVQQGIRYHNPHSQASEIYEMGQTYAGVAHALMTWGIDWRKQYDSRLYVVGGLQPKMVAYMDCLKSMAGEYETPAGEIEKHKRIVFNQWREIAEMYNKMFA